jgi:hypothetical protein
MAGLLVLLIHTRRPDDGAMSMALRWRSAPGTAPFRA